ncbi:hypothetical protein BDR26DRAFT_580687 [Obelidium mucronatum]|nr:hypothetical protein BDR26DRAFT_580687 [Obelidium mucronatum]
MILEFSEKYKISVPPRKWLELRIKHSEIMNAAGLFNLGENLIATAIKESNEFNSKTHELKLRGLFLLSEIRCFKSDSWYSKILDYQRILVKERKMLSRNFLLAECWNYVGDMISIITPDRHEAIAMAYDQADDFLLKFLEPKNGHHIPIASHSLYYALKVDVRYKRALQYKSMSNLFEAHKLINEAALLAKQMRQIISSSASIRITLTLAETIYRSNPTATDVKYSRADVKGFVSDVLLAELAMGGCDYMVLRTSFEGLLATAIEEGDEPKARRLSHYLSHIASLERLSSNQNYEKLSGIDEVVVLDGFMMSEFQQAPTFERTITKAPDIDHQFPSTENTFLSTTLSAILNGRQDLISIRNTCTLFTTDPFHQILEIRIRRYNSCLIAQSSTFANNFCLSNALFDSILVENSNPNNLANAKVNAAYNPNSERLLSHQSCIQWLNLPVRVIIGEGEALNDRLWTLVICFAVVNADEEKRSTPNNRSADTRRSSNSKRVGSAKVRIDGMQQVRPMSSRRASALVLLPSSDNGGESASPLYTTSVPESVINLVLQQTNSTGLSLKKYYITKDQKYLLFAESSFNLVLQTILNAVSKKKSPIMVS